MEAELPSLLIQSSNINYVEGVRVNLPDCCPIEPEHGKLFCTEHAEQLRQAGFPADALGFIKKIKKDHAILGMHGI